MDVYLKITCPDETNEPRCESCGSIVKPSANQKAFGDGEPPQYTFFAWCPRCNLETDLSGRLSKEEEIMAIEGA